MRTRLENAGERSERAADDEVANLDGADVHAALAGPDQVAARGDRVEPPPRPREQDRHDHDHAERPVHRHVRRCTEEPKNVWPPGVSTGKAPEMLSVSPLRT